MTEGVSSTAIALLALMRLRGIGRKKALAIVARPVAEADIQSCCHALIAGLSEAQLPRFPEGELAEAWKRSEDGLHRARDIGVRAMSFHDDDYPARLRGIPDPPAVLFAKGDPAGLHSPKGLAVVGTREPTSFGKKVAQRSAQTAAEAGYTIVSGLAHGCDASAHEGCVEASGVGVAVLAHGLDKVYPAANRDLAERLLENRGCLTSEYPVGTKPARAAFAERDRLQSGLSDAVLVIESDVEGGTMHTVRFAHAQGRPVACVDHPQRWLAEDKTKGNQRLIGDGRATPIPDGEGLARFLSGLQPMPAAEARTEPADPQPDSDDPQRPLPF